MVVAFTFVFWGTGGLTWQKAFEISGSSLTTLGLLQARRDEPHLARLHRGDHRARPGRPPHQLPADDLLRLQRAREGHHPAAADRRLHPRARPTLLQTLHRIGVPRRPAVLDATRPTGCSTWSRRTRPSRSSPTSPRPTPTTPGSPPSGSLLDAAALVVSASRDRGGRGLRGRREGSPDDPRLRPAPRRAHRPGGQHPPAPADEARRGHWHFGEPAPAISIGRDEYLAAMAAVAPILVLDPAAGGGGMAPLRLDPLRLRPGAAGAGGPHRCLPVARGRPIVRPRWDAHASCAGARCTSTGPPACPGEAGAPGRRRCGYRWLKPPDSSFVMDTVTGWRSKWAMDCSMSSSRIPARSRLTPWRTRMRCTETSETDPVSG